ncbi:MAG: FAD-dependent oxidoreductase [Candidatus Melainabacteria bacterium]|nr:FAD-dependent oxidoreductase [Candidatus Melainabacteria bacterium]
MSYKLELRYRMNSTHIVVVGSSYSSAAVFNYLEKYLTKARQPVDLLLLSDKNHYFFRDLLSEYLCDGCGLDDIVQENRDIGFLKPGVSFLQSKILSIDLNLKIIKTTNSVIPYHYLVLAPDCELDDSSEYFTYADNSNCFIFNMPADIFMIKNHIIKNIEKAASEQNDEIKKMLMTFTVVGGCEKAIEIVCSISDYVRNLIKKKYHEINASFVKVNLIEEKNNILENKDPFFNTRIVHSLNKRGVNMLLNSKISGLKKEKIEINHEKEICSGTIIFTPSYKAPSLIKNLLLKHDESEYACVDLYMKADGFDNVFVIGESSKCLDLSENYPRNIAVYKQQSKVCANNIFAKINNNPLKPLGKTLDINFFPLGYKNLLFGIKDFCLDGFIPWIFYRLLYISYFLGWKKNLKAFISFLLSNLALNDQYVLDLEAMSKQKQAVKNLK